jgi:hypothetical protein
MQGISAEDPDCASLTSSQLKRNVVSGYATISFTYCMAFDFALTLVSVKRYMTVREYDQSMKIGQEFVAIFNSQVYHT